MRVTQPISTHPWPTGRCGKRRGADGGGVSVYMAHGGTNFGLWAGANEHEGRLQPTVTSYDSDAPVAELRDRPELGPPEEYVEEFG
ncbi:beta-galactosidase [Nonomuraea sp. NPDC049269]|uniref:beta-galactosidase n=1 Tax=Nonomuraea sp. NPDC049269 TaxID=3364349 RepID=UPI00371C9031